MAALCATRDPELLKRTFAFALSSEVKNQDLSAFFSGLAANPLSKRDQWAFFQENYTEVARRFKGELFSLTKLAQRLTFCLNRKLLLRIPRQDLFPVAHF